jgi:uncharacterized protein (TIGR02466 family)
MDATMDDPVDSTTTLTLFPTRVIAIQLKPEVHEPIDRSVMLCLEGMRTTHPELTSAGRWQTHHDLHRSAELAGLVALIRAAVTELFDALTLAYDRFEISGCWANVTTPGHGHRRHSHPNNYLSGVYYVRTGGEQDCIDFHDPRPQIGLIVPPARDQGRASPDTTGVRVRPGMLVLFPAWLEHSVPPHTGEGLRISVAFNVMFPSFGTEMARPLWNADTTKAD